MTNTERAEHAGAAIAEYLSMKGEPHDQPAEEHEISDLICDLLHHGDRFGFDHDNIISQALMHYEAEKQEAATANLLIAAEAVVTAWESGDLAGAVRALAKACQKVPGQR
jgi:hypothetical protein